MTSAAKFAAVGFIIGLIFIFATHYVLHKEARKRWTLSEQDIANEQWVIQQIESSISNYDDRYKAEEFMKPKRFPKAHAELTEIVDEGYQDWKDFQSKHGRRSINPFEERQRILSFINADRYVDLHNEAFEKKSSSFKVAINEFADYSPDEYKKLNGFVYNAESRVRRDIPSHDIKFDADSLQLIPRAMDWRKHGYVTDVKNQGQCGSCWAFSATGAVEGQYKRKTGNLLAFSEQHLIDCSNERNKGCNGGFTDAAFQFIIDNGGIATEASYPYKGIDSTCLARKFYFTKAPLKKYVDIPYGDETALKIAVAKYGPVSVAIDVDHMGFMLYKEGVYYEKNCAKSPKDLEHAVLVVGYGTDPEHGDYWIVKNSWGTSWGMDGYIYMARNRNNMCGIASEATYPLL